MINRELIEYIKDQKKNASDDAIREALLKVGWHEEDVKAGFLRANAELRSAQSETETETESVEEPLSTEPAQQTSVPVTETVSSSDESEEKYQKSGEGEEATGSDSTPFNGVEIDSPVGGNGDTESGDKEEEGDQSEGQQPLGTTTKSSMKEHGVEIDSPVLAEEKKNQDPEPSSNSSELSMGSGIPYTSDKSGDSSLKRAEDKLSGMAPTEQKEEQTSDKESASQGEEKKAVTEMPARKEGSSKKGVPQAVPVDQSPESKVEHSSGSSIGKILLMLIGAVLLIAAGGVAGYFAYTEFVERESVEAPQSDGNGMPQGDERSL